MARKRSKSVDGFVLPLPPDRKKPRLTILQRCVICQNEIPDISLRKGKQSSVSNLIKAAKYRQDDVFTRLSQDDIDSCYSKELLWHSSCYATYTSSHNIKHASSPDAANVENDTSQEAKKEKKTDRVSRSETSVTDWSKCFICKKKTYKKVTETISVSTFEACQRIKKAATTKGDEDMLHVLRGVNDDLIAADAKYHKNCYALYVMNSKKVVYSSEAGNESETPYDKAFHQLMDELKPAIKEGRAYDMNSLLIRYREFLADEGVAGEGYTRQRLKDRLKNCFGEEVVFHQQSDRAKPELIYASSISLQDVINAWALTHKAEIKVKQENEEEKTKPTVSVARDIRTEIKKSKGITTRPLDSRDIATESTRKLIPDCLYWLVRAIITGESDGINQPKECSNITVERQILSICQDIIHCCTRGRVKLPKHTGLAITVHHLTSSKHLITLLNKMGHCCSYDEMRAIDTSAAMEVLAKTEEFGTVIPSNISPGVFVQLAADNNDINEETLDGKNTTHATTMVVYQKKAFGPHPPPVPLADHRVKRQSLQSTTKVYEIQECSAHGRRPAASAYVNQINTQMYKRINDSFSKASKMDMIWALLRIHPASFEATEESTDAQSVPSWSGYSSILFPDMPQQSNVGYCPMIDGDSTNFSTVYTVLKHAQMISSAMGQEDTVITFDLLIYMKAKQIQWRYPDEFSDVVIRMGGFHIALNFLSLLGKKYLDSGLDDLLIESGVYAAGSISALMKGKSYNRGMRAHKLVSEAMFRLMWTEFLEWYSRTGATIRNEEGIVQSITDTVNVVKQKSNLPERVTQLESDLHELTTLYESFHLQARAESQMFAFWEQYCQMVNALLQLIKAERTGNWNLYLSALVTLTPHFFSMDRQNYARWLPVYIEDMHQLKSLHPKVYEEFATGNFSISRTGQPFSQVATDMALEQSINADSKSKGGIVGISQSPAALERWFLTAHERASVTTALREMYGDSESDQTSHKEAAPQRVKRDEEDVRKLTSCFSSGLMTNPFNLEEIQSLVNVATGVVLPENVAECLLACKRKGQEQMIEFIEERLNTNEVSFWDPIPKLKVKTFSSMTKRVTVKASDDKIATVSADRDLFGRLLIVANARQINLMEVMTYELSPIPCALAHQDGTLRKNAKCQLANIIEKLVDVVPQLQVSPENTVYILDGMAFVQMTKSGGTATFGELAAKYYSIFSSPLTTRKCNCVHIVFDQYFEMSIKAGERSRRGTSSALEVHIHGPSTPVPKQWAKYINNPKNKKNLCDFLTKSMCCLGKGRLPENTKLIIGGGFKDGRRSVAITRDSYGDVADLTSNHEEADTRMLFHAKHAANPEARIVIQSPDTDVLVLSAAHFASIAPKEMWFRTGVKDQMRFVPVHDVCQKLGDKVLAALPAFHAVTGCDSNSSISGIGKTKAWKAMMKSQVHQESLGLLGKEQNADEETLRKCEAFICDIYPTSKKRPQTADELRYLMFCQKKQKNETLPPTSDSLRQHIHRANYQAYTWRCSLDGFQEIPSPVGHGWVIEDEELQPLLMTKDPAPSSLLELTTCACKKSECQRNCSCANVGLSCTEACTCMADETCCNPHGIQWEEDDASDSDSDD